jgi:hypothetical protein
MGGSAQKGQKDGPATRMGRPNHVGSSEIDCISLAVVVHFETPHHACESEVSQLDFSTWFDGLKPLTDIVQVLAGLGLVTVTLAVAKHFVERRAWRRYKLAVDDWINRLDKLGGKHPKELEEHDWRVECERMLSDANFSPLQVVQLLDAAVIVAKGIAADKGLL